MTNTASISNSPVTKQKHPVPLFEFPHLSQRHRQTFFSDSVPPSQQHVKEPSQKLEALHSKKRKAPSSGEAQTLIAGLFDSVAEHAEKLAKMKRKKQKSMKRTS